MLYGKEIMMYNINTMSDFKKDDFIKITESDYLDLMIDTCSQVICFEYESKCCSCETPKDCHGYKEFTELSEFITHKQNGFITFEIPKNRLKSMLSNILLEDLDRPPRNRLRIIVFKDGTGLETSEKLSIVGSIIGRGKAITQEDLYDTMLHINDNGDKITISKIAKYLNCTSRTIHRHMSDDLKKEKEKLNINNEKI